MKRPSYPVGINTFVMKENKLLLGKRKNCAGEGEWGLPGGHLETGESMLDAAARELAEETSIKAKKMAFVNLTNDKGNAACHYIQVGFIVEEFSGEVELMEPERCSEWQWFDLDELPENVFFDHKKQVNLFLEKEPFGESAG